MDRVAASFVEEGFSDDSRPVKIHATLMNSKWRKKKDQHARGESFDASAILSTMAGFDFGLAPVTAVHLSKMSRKAERYYDAESIVAL